MSISARDLGGSGDDTQQVDPTRTAPVPAADDRLVTAKGTTTIAPRVIATIARQAASEVAGVAGVEATGLQGVLSSLRSSSAGGATADVAARRATIDLNVAVRWPQPIAEVTTAVRDHVRRRVHELTGHAVTEVDIAVTSLPEPPSTPHRRVV